MLEMGLLWYEPGTGIPFSDRVDAAAERYLERFGVAPNVCLVPLSEPASSDRIGVRPDKRMRPGHIMVGIDREDADALTWKPLVRSSDEVGVVLLGPNGEEINRLRPVRQKRASPRTGAASPISKDVKRQPKARVDVPPAAPTKPKQPVPVVAVASPLRPRPKAEPQAAKPLAAPGKSGAKTPKAVKQLPLALDPAPAAPRTSKSDAPKLAAKPGAKSATSAKPTPSKQVPPAKTVNLHSGSRRRTASA